MGRSDRQKEKRDSGLKGRKANNEIIEFERILIVCEDTKTAPNYLNAFCRSLGLSKANAKAIGSNRNAPSLVLECAKNKIDTANNAGDDYDRVYCVIDRDDWKCFDKTIQKIGDGLIYEKTKIIAIPSIPCIEVWFILHFDKSFASFENAEATKRKLKNILKKRDIQENYFSNRYQHILKDKTDDAIKHAKQLLETGGDNPTTYMHILIEDLINESKKA